MSKKLKWTLYILIVLFAAVFIFSGAVLIHEYMMRERDSETFEELTDLILLPETSEEVIYDYSMSESLDTSENVENIQTTVVHKRNLEPLFSRNSDCIGWIYIEGTEVNYPVMHTVYDPEKYIDLSFDLKYSAYGVPFLDHKCTAVCDNLVIYGHNMNDGSMFASIRRFMDKKYFLEHPYIEFETVDGCKTYAVFAIVSLKASDQWYSYHNFDDRNKYVENINRLISKSLYDTGVMPEYGKQIITLSTCYGVARDDRLILLAVEE